MILAGRFAAIFVQTSGRVARVFSNRWVLLEVRANKFTLQCGCFFINGLALLIFFFKRAIQTPTLPQYLSSDHDPLNRFHQWQANLRVLEIQEIKTVPYVNRVGPVANEISDLTRQDSPR